MFSPLKLKLKTLYKCPWIRLSPFDFHISFTLSLHTNSLIWIKWDKAACPSHTRPLSMQHFNKQVVAGHLSTQMHVTQVVLCLCAEGPQLWQPNHQLAKLLLELWVGGYGILQQSPIHLLLDTLHECLVLQQLHICTAGIHGSIRMKYLLTYVIVMYSCLMSPSYWMCQNSWSTWIYWKNQYPFLTTNWAIKKTRMEIKFQHK